MSPGLSAGLGAVILRTARGGLEGPVLEAAKSRLFHAWGVALASSGLDPAQVAWRTVENRSGDCVVFARPHGLAAEDAAFVNGVTSHSSLQEDCGPGGLREGSHPSTYVLPAALAAAEEVGASGRDFLAGVVAGYEAVSRIGAAAPAEIVHRRFRPVAVMGPFGSAAASSVVLGATAEQIASALDIAANMAGGSTQGIFEGTMEPYFHAGLSARNGLFASRMAMAGAVTSEHSLEGDFGFFVTYGGVPGDPDELLGERDSAGICRVGTKQFAACLQNQQSVALIVTAFPTGITSDRVKRLTVRRPKKGTNGLDSPGVSRPAPFHNMLEAQMSARFTAAAALLGHDVRDPRFFQRDYADPEITALAERTDLVESPDESVVVTIVLAGEGDRVLDADMSGVLFPTAEAIRASFLERARSILGAAADEAAGMIDRLEELPDIAGLTRLFRVDNA